MMIKTSKNNGFTLIELLVGIAVFVIVIGAFVEVFVSGVKTQRRSLAYQELLDQTSYVMEYMSRALRMAKKGDDSCVNSNLNYKVPDDGSGEWVKFVNYKDECQKFEWKSDAGKLKLVEERNSGGDVPLTFKDSIAVNFFKVTLSGAENGDLLQPRVTISLEIESKKVSGVKIKTQTTISQRNLDI